MNSKYFKLYASCVVVNGYSESLIYDLERNESYLLPNGFLKPLNNLQKTKFRKFIKENEEYKSILESFVKQLIDAEIAFFTDDPDAFLKLDLNWKYPYTISNAIIELNTETQYDFKDVLNQLCSLGCQATQIIFESKFSLAYITKILNFFNESSIKCIEVHMLYDSNLSTENLYRLLDKQPRLRQIKILESPEITEGFKFQEFYENKIIYSSENLIQNRIPSIERNNFQYNLPIFTEAQNHNLGLNRKVSISADGNIKNYLNHEKIFGNIKNTSLKEVVINKNFQMKWFISNDQIEKCKDCQFRYVCVNNSDIELRNEKYFKTELCEFDPYNNVWHQKINI